MVAVFRFAFALAVTVAFVMAVLPHPPRLPGEPSDKVLHILAFTVLGSLAVLAFPKRSVSQLVLALVALGALIEAVQAIPALNRDSELLDLVADAAAALAAAWAMRRATGGRYPAAQNRE